LEHPNFKVTITHGGASTDYTNSVFSKIQVKRRENNYDVATLLCADENSVLYQSSIDVLDEIKIYFKDVLDTVWTQVFGGNIRQALPTNSSQGFFMQLLCKGYGAALEETSCNRDYGLESSHSSLDTAKEIWQDLVDNFINKSLGSANPTGYAITKTKIADVAAATPIKYINVPYKECRDVVNTVCTLTSAIGAGSAPGAHWIVDNNKNLIINTIGTHENPAEWPDWWNVTEANSTLVQGIDFTNLTVLDKSEEFSNNVVLVTDFRRPTYDYWTEDSGGEALWGSEDLAGKSNCNTAGYFIVGSHSLKLDSNPTPTVPAYAYYPLTADLGWDVTRWGSEKTPPRINFYVYKHLINNSTTFIQLSNNKTARKTDFYYGKFLDWGSDPEDTWLHKSIPIGPYWKSDTESSKFRWLVFGDPDDWTRIDSVEFIMVSSANGSLYIDDLHFTGKIIRSAKNTTNIMANHEFQKVLISRNAMDDSCKANDDSGFAGRIAYAELLRRQSLPTTIIFQTTMHPEMMAGQKCHIHACKKADGTFRIDTPMRILTVQHDLESSATSTVTATTDLKNSVPISVPDQYAMWQENMFLNSKEAKNIRSGAEVDLLIPIIQRDYP